MSFTRKNDSYGWTYCNKCRSVNGDVHGQILLCDCDRKEIEKSKPSKKLKNTQKKFSDTIKWIKVEKRRKKDVT